MDDALRQAWLARLQDPQHAASLLDGNPSSQAAVVRAYAAWRAGQYTDAIGLTTAHEPDLQRSGDALWLGRALYIRGCVLSITGDPAGGLACFQDQLALAQQCDDAELEGLAHNGIGSARFNYDAPQRALRSYARAVDVFERAVPPQETNLGLTLMNLALAHGTLGNAALEVELLNRAETLLFRSKAWSFWASLLNLRALRLARAGQLDGARALFTKALALPLPHDSIHRVWYSQAQVEALYGDAGTALGQLARLNDWAHVRQDFLGDYLDTRATAQARGGDAAAAYASVRELLELTRSIQAHERSIQMRAQEHKPHLARSAALDALSRQDVLTGLSNRRDFQQRGAALLERQRPLILGLIDVDNFKQVNDRYGHAVGDAVLSAIASRILERVGPQDLVARLGGDEFVIMHEGRDLDAFCSTMQDLCQVKADEFIQIGVVDLRITLSIGVARVSGTLSSALEQADRAMYHAKHNGKSTVHILNTSDDR